MDLARHISDGLSAGWSDEQRAEYLQHRDTVERMRTRLGHITTNMRNANANHDLDALYNAQAVYTDLKQDYQRG